jgi:K+:H+ antiporter
VHEPLLRDLVVLLVAAVPIVVLFRRLRLPTIVGFVLAGVLLGPNGLGAIGSSENVDRLAEFGVVLLLFVIGIELSLPNVLRLGFRVLSAALMQVVLTTAVAGGLAVWAGLSVPQAVLVGFLAVHSSTIVALKVLSERGQIDAPQGQTASAIAIVQDLAMVPMMLLIPVLAEGREIETTRLATVAGGAVLVIAAIVAGARVILPVILRQAARLGSRELFTVTVLLLALGTAWLADQLGLSLALGALIAGLVISGSDYSHEVFAEILPFRDVFASLFFLSIGMLLPLDFLFEHGPAILGAAAGVMAVKLALIAAPVLVLLRSARLALIVAVCLCQLGELSFVLARGALSSGLLPQAHYEAFIAVAVVTFIASPLLVGPVEAMGFRWAEWRGVLPAAGAAPEAAASLPRVVIVGYGLNGRNLARVLKETGIPFAVLELNAVTVEAARKAGVPIVYGDGSRPDVLRAVGADMAGIVVVAISDPASTRRITLLVRRMNPSAEIIVRTRFVIEIDELYRLGASEVVPEEFETSVEIFARVLRRLHVPRNVIQLQVDIIRQERYGMLRGLALPSQSLSEVEHLLARTLTETVLVDERSPAAGRSIADLRLRRETGATVIAVIRAGSPHVNPDPAFEIAVDDLIVLLGGHEALDRALERLAATPQGPI